LCGEIVRFWRNWRSKFQSSVFLRVIDWTWKIQSFWVSLIQYNIDSHCQNVFLISSSLF
jgi:hypothetical protein